MTIRVTGLNSGLDTDSIIKELVSAYRSKGDKIKKQQTKLSWTQDKWKSLNAKVLNLYKSLDSLRFTSGYNMKKTSVSDATKATVSAGKGAVNGTQKLKVEQVANGGYLTGAELDKNKVSKGAATKLSELGFTGSDSGEIRLRGNGKDTYLKVDGNTTIDDFVKQINNSEAGVQASYDETNRRLFIVAKETGADNDFMLAATDEKGADALYAMGINTQSETGNKEAGLWITKYVSGKTAAETEALLRADIKAAADAKDKKEGAEAAKAKAQEKNAGYGDIVKYITAKKDQEAVKNINQDVDDLTELANMSAADREKEYETDASGKLLRDADGKLIEATASSAHKVKGSDILDSEEKINQVKAYKTNADAVIKYETENPDKIIASADLDTELQKNNDAIKDNEDIIKDSDTAIAEAETDLKNYDLINSDRLKSSLKAGDGDPYFEVYVDLMKKKVDYFSKNYTETSPGSGEWQLSNKSNKINTDAHKEDGKNARIYLNGAKFESSSNTFNINGLSIQALSTTSGSEEVTITTATDTQGLYDKIKDFISEYNSIINEMSSLYNADSAKGYEPLTSEEKEALSESEVADWEKKIKDSLLRRDGNLSTLMNVMTSAMSKTYNINGKSYSLASLGIKTGSYFKTTAKNRYELHIDGDADDETTSANADKLMSMLNSDPDTVISLIQGVASELSDKLGKQMKPSTMRSYQSIYNDKAMAQSYSDYTKKISAWEQKVTEIEDSYYKKFAAMETALAKLQNQQSAFAGMLGS